MNIRILFFGATADVAGTREIALTAVAGDTAGDIFNVVTARYPLLQDHKLLYSVNQEFASGFEAIRDGDELAVFTAVSGG